MSTRPKRRKSSRTFGKLWLPAVVLAVIAIVSYGVNTVRHLNGAITNPPSATAIPATVVEINPKNVTYEVFGSLGGGGKVTYADLNSAANRSHAGVAALVAFGNDDGILGLVESRRTGGRRLGGVSDPGERSGP